MINTIYEETTVNVTEENVSSKINNNCLFTSKYKIILFFEFLKKWKTVEWILWSAKKVLGFIFVMSFIEIIFYICATDYIKQVLLYNPKNYKEVWRFITYMLIHNNLTHLALNLIVQAILGFTLELEHGSGKCAAIFFTSGLAGSVGAGIFCPSTLLAGASGGIYGLLMAHLANIIWNHESVKYLQFRILAVTTLTLSDAVYIFYHVWFCNNEKPVIGWVAHVSGGLSGFCLGLLIFSKSTTMKKN